MKPSKLLPILGIGVLALTSCGSMNEITRETAKTRLEAISNYQNTSSFEMPRVTGVNVISHTKLTDKIESKFNVESKNEMKAGYDLDNYRAFYSNKTSKSYYDSDEEEFKTEESEMHSWFWINQEKDTNYLYVAVETIEVGEIIRTYTKREVEFKERAETMRNTEIYEKFSLYSYAGNGAIGSLIEVDEEASRLIIMHDEGDNPNINVNVKHRFGSNGNGSLQGTCDITVDGQREDDSTKITVSSKTHEDVKIENYVLTFYESSNKASMFSKDDIDSTMESYSKVERTGGCDFSKPDLKNFRKRTL